MCLTVKKLSLGEYIMKYAPVPAEVSENFEIKSSHLWENTTDEILLRSTIMEVYDVDPGSPFYVYHNGAIALADPIHWAYTYTDLGAVFEGLGFIGLGRINLANQDAAIREWTTLFKQKDPERKTRRNIFSNPRPKG